MSGKTPKETVQLALLDPLLYGAANAFAYLGVRGQVMLDKVGDGILDYCFKEGYIQRSDDFQQLTRAVVAFFLDNGYLGAMDMVQEEGVNTATMQGWQFLGLMKKLRNQDCYLLSCPLCVAVNTLMRSNGIARQMISEGITPDGKYVAKGTYAPLSTLEQSPGNPPKLADMNKLRLEIDPATRIGLPAFEAVEYGLARGFDYLGAQAQVLLDNVGSGMIEFLQDEYKLKLGSEHEKSLNTTASFYARSGLADKIEVDLSPSEITVAFGNYRYAPVLKRLLDEDLRLSSCPFTLAGRRILRNAGYVVEDMRWKLEGHRDVTLTLPLLRIGEQEFDEERIGNLMDAV